MTAKVTRRYIDPMRFITRFAAGICAVFAFAGLAGAGQAAAPAAPAAAAAPGPLVRIEPGDQIRVEVLNSPDLSTATYVTETGLVRMPMIGAVQVSGQSPAEAEQRIEQALKVGGILIDPHVTISLVQSFSQRVTIAGEVRTPGRYPIETGSTVLDILALAGGLTEKGSDSVYLLRADPSGAQQQLQVQVNASDILAGRAGNSAATMVLRGGDSIIVPKATFNIIGEVKQPNEYRVEAGMTLLQAIARAGGVTPAGSASRVEIQRRGADGKYKEIKARKDTVIQADDVIRVKESIF